MNFKIPLYDLNGDDMPQNTTVYSMQVKAFLCPSDVRSSIEIEFEIAVQLRRVHRRRPARRVRSGRLVRSTQRP